ncbi:MAG: hypothetical protein COW01_00395 [Bdellovibrionales bacterium CG12_big_fil_rev_8_21_14_0_65_38_15]|nr:MAG: hypothetical protein COW79_09925 [Bdellovibrionales bacterium CG22_combo_CG10-13_8_21_14_all_38_13]PIQ57427.1 MAG: hypothetical protein COW01_00395 [Bdellovibrionales bacterium CG12_big_fil_rev_8_21_14_0_65_38_15]PIR31147.1 MAG: hypothetical protein COV38_01875 [Bdellovibrionales bacterium CG11_big_fil_rev_8_21_14_0_20_38_13]
MENFNSIQPITWAALGLCIILAALCFFLFLRLKNFNQQQDQSLKDRQEHWSESARIVALAVSQGQCDLSEGCLRLRYILNQLGDTHEVLEMMGEELKPFATHKARSELDAQTRFAQDKIRMEIEGKYEVRLQSLCQEIVKKYDLRGA